jgi:hypothetical protein
VSGRRARSNATSKGATAIQESTYKFGRGKIMICNTAEAMASRHALLSIRRMNEKGYQEIVACRAASRRRATNSTSSLLTYSGGSITNTGRSLADPSEIPGQRDS